jgi:hypothetical protein
MTARCLPPALGLACNPCPAPEHVDVHCNAEPCGDADWVTAQLETFASWTSLPICVRSVAFGGRPRQDDRIAGTASQTLSEIWLASPDTLVMQHELGHLVDRGLSDARSDLFDADYLELRVPEEGWHHYDGPRREQREGFAATVESGPDGWRDVDETLAADCPASTWMNDRVRHVHDVVFDRVRADVGRARLVRGDPVRFVSPLPLVAVSGNAHGWLFEAPSSHDAYFFDSRWHAWSDQGWRDSAYEAELHGRSVLVGSISNTFLWLPQQGASWQLAPERPLKALHAVPDGFMGVTDAPYEAVPIDPFGDLGDPVPGWRAPVRGDHSGTWEVTVAFRASASEALARQGRLSLADPRVDTVVRDPEGRARHLVGSTHRIRLGDMLWTRHARRDGTHAAVLYDDDARPWAVTEPCDVGPLVLAMDQVWEQVDDDGLITLYPLSWAPLP